MVNFISLLKNNVEVIIHSGHHLVQKWDTENATVAEPPVHADTPTDNLYDVGHVLILLSHCFAVSCWFSSIIQTHIRRRPSRVSSTLATLQREQKARKPSKVNRSFIFAFIPSDRSTCQTFSPVCKDLLWWDLIIQAFLILLFIVSFEFQLNYINLKYQGQ